MQSKQKSRWVVDATLFTGFILAFFLDSTGLTLHQWIGLAAAALAVYHFLTHAAWVEAVTSRFFGRLTARSRLYYLIDAALLIGFATITVTGLVISSWLDLQLAGYAAWRTVHIAASIGTLLVTVLKIGLHWRWIVLTARNLVFRYPPHTPRQQAGSVFLGRREFTRVMGVVGLSSIIALASSIESLRAGGNAQSDAETNTASSSPDIRSVKESAVNASANAASCFVRCQRRCAFPGHCRKYVDSNNSGRCDLGECA